jgi:hypothetical protein
MRSDTVGEVYHGEADRLRREDVVSWEEVYLRLVLGNATRRYRVAS